MIEALFSQYAGYVKSTLLEQQTALIEFDSDQNA